MTNHYLLTPQGILSGPIELPVIPGLGIQLPSNAVSLAKKLPAPKAGHCWVLTDGNPTEVQDFRGQVYSTETGEPLNHTEPGPLPDGVTNVPRPSPDHAWKDGQWKLDAALQAENATAARKAQHARIDAERDARIDAGIEFQGKRYQSRATDRENIAGAAQLGFMAVVAGKQAGDLHWSDPDQDFTWIASDNSLVPMDAPTVVALGKAAAERKQALIFAARQLKDMEQIPADYADDKWWP